MPEYYVLRSVELHYISDFCEIWTMLSMRNLERIVIFYDCLKGPLISDFPLRMDRSGWNVQERMVLVRNAYDKNFSLIFHTRPDLRLVLVPTRRIGITPWLYWIQRSNWFQIKASLSTQLFIGQNFEIPFHSFFISILVDRSSK